MSLSSSNNGLAHQSFIVSVIRYFNELHCVQKKTPTYVFDYNSGISLSRFLYFYIPVETGRNTLQNNDLVAL